MISEKDFTVYILLHSLSGILVGAAIMGVVVSIKWAYLLALGGIIISLLTKRVLGARVMGCIEGYNIKSN